MRVNNDDDNNNCRILVNQCITWLPDYRLLAATKKHRNQSRQAVFTGGYSRFASGKFIMFYSEISMEIGEGSGTH